MSSPPNYDVNHALDVSSHTGVEMLPIGGKASDQVFQSSTCLDAKQSVRQDNKRG